MAFKIILEEGPASFHSLRNLDDGCRGNLLLPTPQIRVTKTRPAGSIVTDWSALHRSVPGSVRAITGSDGLKIERSVYRPFGEKSGWVQAGTDPAETKGFIGERFDADAGLQYLNARYYDPELGMFIQPDWWEVQVPGVGTNRYAYAGNDPVNASAALGHYPEGTVVNDKEKWDKKDYDTAQTIAHCDSSNCQAGIAYLDTKDIDHVREVAIHWGPEVPNTVGKEEIRRALEEWVGSHADDYGPIAAIEGLRQGAVSLGQAINMALTGSFSGVALGPSALHSKVAAAAERGVPEGIVCLRTDITGKIAPYGGQAMNDARFLTRQAEHARAFPDSRSNSRSSIVQIRVVRWISPNTISFRN